MKNVHFVETWKNAQYLEEEKNPLFIDLLESINHSAAPPPPISMLTVLGLCFLFIHFALAHFFTDALCNVGPTLLI